MSEKLAPEIRSQVAKMLKDNLPYREIADAVGVSRTSVMRIRHAPPAYAPVGASADAVREALNKLNQAFDYFERSQTKDSYDAWREALRVYDDTRREAAAR